MLNNQQIFEKCETEDCLQQAFPLAEEMLREISDLVQQERFIEAHEKFHELLEMNLEIEKAFIFLRDLDRTEKFGRN